MIDRRSKIRRDPNRMIVLGTIINVSFHYLCVAIVDGCRLFIRLFMVRFGADPGHVLLSSKHVIREREKTSGPEVKLYNNPVPVTSYFRSFTLLLLILFFISLPPWGKRFIFIILFIINNT